MLSSTDAPVTPSPRPLVRARVAVPLGVLAVSACLVYLVWGTRGESPFGPLVSPPPEDWSPPVADEVTLWAWGEGMKHYQTGAFDEASVLLGRAAGGMPSQPPPMFFAGVCHLLSGRPEAAVDLFGRAVELRPDEARYRYYLAWAEWQREGVDEAESQLKRAAEGEGKWARKARKVLGRIQR